MKLCLIVKMIRIKKKTYIGNEMSLCYSFMFTYFVKYAKIAEIFVFFRLRHYGRK